MKEENDEDKIESNEHLNLKIFDEKSTLESMLKLMKPGETVTKTIKRLGSIIEKKFVSRRRKTQNRGEKSSSFLDQKEN